MDFVKKKHDINMIAMNKIAQNSTKLEKLQMLGYGLLEMNESNGNFEIIFQKGIGVPLIQNIIELYKKEILTKKQGNSIIPLDDFTIFIQYFKNNSDEISIILYMEEKEHSVNFSKLYFLSKQINKKLLSNTPIIEIIRIFETQIEIPKSEGIIAIFIIGSAGSPFLSKINKTRSNISCFSISNASSPEEAVFTSYPAFERHLDQPNVKSSSSSTIKIGSFIKSYSSVGKSSVKVVPSSNLLSTRISPPCSSIIR